MYFVTTKNTLNRTIDNDHPVVGPVRDLQKISDWNKKPLEAHQKFLSEQEKVEQAETPANP